MEAELPSNPAALRRAPGPPPTALAAALLTLVLLAVAGPSPARATTARQLDDGELVDRAPLIVVGRCLGTRTERLDRRLVTLARFEVVEVLKDSRGGLLPPDHPRGRVPEEAPPAGTLPTVTVVLPGGRETAGPFPLAEVWPGAPELATDEQAVLFLRPFSSLAGSWAVVGFTQGKFTVVDGGGELRVTRDLSGTRLLASDGSLRAGGARGEPLDGFVRRVRERVAAAATPASDPPAGASGAGGGACRRQASDEPAPRLDPSSVAGGERPEVPQTPDDPPEQQAPEETCRMGDAP